MGRRCCEDLALSMGLHLVPTHVMKITFVAENTSPPWTTTPTVSTDSLSSRDQRGAEVKCWEGGYLVLVLDLEGVDDVEDVVVGEQRAEVLQTAGTGLDELHGLVALIPEHGPALASVRTSAK